MEGETRITDYRPVKPKKLPGSRIPRAAESLYWKSFSSKNIQKQIASVSCVHFCPEPPYHFAVTSSTRVTVYDGETCKVKKTISRFTDVAYSGVFRPDGQLLVAGGEMGIIQAFDMNSRLVLRQLKGHTRAVHWVRYSPTDKLHLLSGSDDNTVRWWDMATQTELLKLEGHTDYVRSGSAHPSSPDLWATGSYDHTANLWDLRTGNFTLQMQHGKPLEDVLFFPSGGLIATAGGNVVKIWDVLGGGKLLHTLKNHQKTVTCLCITPPMKASPSDAISAPRLMTGSLDGHIKVFDVSDFKVVHASKYPSPVMSMDISKSMWTMAVGTSSGDLFIRQRKKAVQADTVAAGSVSGAVQEHLKAERVLRPTNYRYFLRGRTEKATEEDYVVKQRERLPQLHEHDKFFRKFQHKEALLSALKTKNPTVVIAVIEELIFRHGLISSISNLDAASLELLLAFLNKYTTVPRFSRILIPFAHKVLDKCSTDFTQSKSILYQVSELRKAVREEVSLQESLQSLQGLLKPILRASLQ